MPTESAASAPSILGYAILQLVAAAPASGYDLKDRFQSSLGRGWHAYDTQIYRELKRLELNGYTTGEVTKGRSGPQRRLYAITDVGMEALQDWLASPLNTSKFKDEFLLRLWSTPFFRPGEAMDFMQRARLEWQGALSHAQDALRSLQETHGTEPELMPDEAIGREFGIELTIALLKARLKWVDHTIKVLHKRDAAQ